MARLFEKMALVGLLLGHLDLACHFDRSSRKGMRRQRGEHGGPLHLPLFCVTCYAHFLLFCSVEAEEESVRAKQCTSAARRDTHKQA